MLHPQALSERTSAMFTLSSLHCLVTNIFDFCGPGFGCSSMKISADMNFCKPLPYSTEPIVGLECISSRNHYQSSQNNSNNDTRGNSNDDTGLLLWVGIKHTGYQRSDSPRGLAGQNQWIVRTDHHRNDGVRVEGKRKPRSLIRLLGCDYNVQ